nr:unknown [Picea sitchensis]
MRSAGALVCIFVVVLDVVAGILGIQGEIAQNEVRGFRYLVFECREPSYSAFRLGIAAACLLLIAHFLANVGGGCIFFASRDDMQQSPLNKQVAVVCLLFSW